MDISQYIKELFGRRFWGGALFLGWLIFLSYYIHIGYLPDFDFFSLAHFLLAGALVGAFLIFSISVITLSPALVWRTTIIGNEGYAKFEFESERSTSLMTWFAGPFVPLFVSCFSAFYMDFIGWPASIITFSVISGVFLSTLLLDLGLTKNGVTHGWLYWQYMICWYASWVTFVVPLGVIALFVFGAEKLAGPTIGEFFQWIFFFSLSIVAILFSVIALQHLPARFENVAPKWRVGAQFMTVGGIFALVLFLIPGVWPLLPTMVMRNLGLGGDIPVHVALSDDGWKVASAFGVSTSDRSDNFQPIALSLRSRLGSEFVFFHHGAQFSLPKSAVLGVLFDKKAKYGEAAK